MHVRSHIFLLILAFAGCKSTDSRTSDVKGPLEQQDPSGEQRCMCIGEWQCSDNSDINGTAEAKDLNSENACREELLKEAALKSACDTYVINEETFTSDCIVIKTAQ